MRKQRETTKPLVGQILFTEVRTDGVVLDCLLTRDGSATPAVPMTFVARLKTKLGLGEALDLLDWWAEDGTMLEVSINPGKRGPEVQISSPSARLILEPDSPLAA